MNWSMIKELREQATYRTDYGDAMFVEHKFVELLVKKCAYLVNDYQRTTGYTDFAKMLCQEFGIEYIDEDYFGVEE